MLKNFCLYHIWYQNMQYLLLYFKKDLVLLWSTWNIFLTVFTTLFWSIVGYKEWDEITSEEVFLFLKKIFAFSQVILMDSDSKVSKFKKYLVKTHVGQVEKI